MSEFFSESASLNDQNDKMTSDEIKFNNSTLKISLETKNNLQKKYEEILNEVEKLIKAKIARDEKISKFVKKVQEFIAIVLVKPLKDEELKTGQRYGLFTYELAKKIFANLINNYFIILENDPILSSNLDRENFLVGDEIENIKIRRFLGNVSKEKENGTDKVKESAIKGDKAKENESGAEENVKQNLNESIKGNEKENQKNGKNGLLEKPKEPLKDAKNTSEGSGETRSDMKSKNQGGDKKKMTENPEKNIKKDDEKAVKTETTKKDEKSNKETEIPVTNLKDKVPKAQGENLETLSMYELKKKFSNISNEIKQLKQQIRVIATSHPNLTQIDSFPSLSQADRCPSAHENLWNNEMFSVKKFRIKHKEKFLFAYQ